MTERHILGIIVLSLGLLALGLSLGYRIGRVNGWNAAQEQF